MKINNIINGPATFVPEKPATTNGKSIRQPTVATLSLAIFDAVLDFAARPSEDCLDAAVVLVGDVFCYESTPPFHGTVVIDLEPGIEILIGYDLTAREQVQQGWTLVDAEVVAERWYEGVLAELEERNQINP